MSEHVQGTTTPDTKPVKKRNETWEWIKSLLIAFVLALLIRQFLFAIFMVDGQSMVPTLQDRERLVVNKLVYHLHKPEYNDILVFKYPSDESKDFIKRVIGLPGDKIEIRDFKVFRNGQELDESFIAEPTGPTEKTFAVPDGMIFVMGDNRNYSKDSRDPQVGYVKDEEIIGRAEIVWWPFGNFRKI
ncbi:signal peptidase I [Tumebacillus permanentifrigoris]|uniref:Signal peptidase I n=1 Tax=Tumebacillus permanentifrigoris TaxID=378543 RepID=A0A316D7P5_9BACL|nr:signal peptidase I [Tumebacillus permanentifrigoris]PWK12749.1 signal peptidase I [Tumebacillus permanentifrigoris]